MAQIMVVESDGNIRELLADDLRDAGFLVIEAGSTDAAVELLHVEPVEVLITDVDLPGILTGLELAKTARERSPDIPIVFISAGLAGPEDVSEINAPVTFLLKPFSLTAFVAAVHAAAPYRRKEHLGYTPG